MARTPTASAERTGTPAPTGRSTAAPASQPEQLRVRERHHPRSWSLSAASAGSNSATRRRGGGVNGSESAGRGICCRKLCYFLNKAGDRAPAAASHHIHHAAQRLVM